MEPKVAVGQVRLVAVTEKASVQAARAMMRVAVAVVPLLRAAERMVREAVAMVAWLVAKVVHLAAVTMPREIG